MAELCFKFRKCHYRSSFKVDPINSDIIYVAGGRFDGDGIGIYKSSDLGNSWIDITGNINAPNGSNVSAIAPVGNGKVYIAIDDSQLLTWHKGKVFFTSNDGNNWDEVVFANTEDRFVCDVEINPFNLSEVWIGQAPLYNDGLEQPILFKSTNDGNSWQPIIVNCNIYGSSMQILSLTSDGKLFISAGQGVTYSADEGLNFIDITPSLSELPFVDPSSIAVHPDNSNILYLPLRASGIGYSNTCGSTWIPKNNGILQTSINLLATDPKSPERIYCASWQGEGVFRTDDYGQNWQFLNKGGIVHPWDDELLVDPLEPQNVWYVSDVPFIHKSSNYGENWTIMNHPYQMNNFNFSSVYSMGQSNDARSFYALNNGFGIFKGQRASDEEGFIWEFLNLSEVDYSYSIAVSPYDDNVLFSGYSRKPFEAKAKIRGSYDGGATWFTSFEIDGASAVTSVVFDKAYPNQLYATSVGDNGAILWNSSNNGTSWDKLNEYFNFTTIHSFASGTGIIYAGVWGGGTYRTVDSGNTWQKLKGDETFSAAAMAVNSNNADIIYLADRTKPIVYKSYDRGESWSVFFNAGSEFRRIMSITIAPNDNECIYVSAMKIGGPGKDGGLFRIENNSVTDMSGSLSKVPLTITIDPKNPSIIYLVLHESGIYKSIDSGNSWLKISGDSSGLPESGFNNLYVDPNNSERLFLIGGCDVKFSTFESVGLDPDVVNGVYLSTNGGNTWKNTNNGVLGKQSGSIKSLCFYNESSDIIFLGSEKGVFYSQDAGDSWEKSNELPYNTLGGISIAGSRIYAYTNGAGVFVGDIQSDYSILWENESKLHVPVYFAQILKDKGNSSTVFASGYPGGIFKSTDNGNTWHEKNFGMVSFKVDDPLRQGYYVLDQSESNPQVLYLGLFQKGVYKSTNGGDTWYPINGHNWELLNKKITGLAIDKLNENEVFIATENGIYQTYDGGESWNSINTGLRTLDIKTIYCSPTNQIYAGTKGYGLYQWNNHSWMAHNGFGNWGVIWPMWNDRPMYQYTSLLIHPNDNSKMLLGTFPQGIYMSSDAGANWKESNLGWTFDGVFSLICHPDNPEMVFAGTYNGMNRSTDFGKHWEMWDHGMPSEQWVFSIDFDPSNPDIIYACSKNGENEGTGREGFRGTVMKSVDGGNNWFEITNGLVHEEDGLFQEFYKIIVDHYNSNIIYLAAQYRGVYISHDAGNSWELWNEGLTNTIPGANGNNVTNTLVLSADHSMLYFGTSGAGVWRRMIAPVLPVNNLSAKVNNHKVILRWSFDDISANFKQYNVYRSEFFFDKIENLSPLAKNFNVSDTFYTDISISQGHQYFYSVTTCDQSGYENPHFFTLGPVVDIPIQIQTTKLDSGYLNIAYIDTLFALGGQSPYYWKKIDGTLPTGLTVSDCGIVSGRPTQQGVFTFIVEVTDSQSPPSIDSLQCEVIIMETTTIESDENIPREFALKQNYPNPFNPITTIQYDLPRKENVKIEIYDLLGQKIASLINAEMPAGYHQIQFNADNLSSGVYLYVMKSDSFSDVKKMLFLK